MAFDSLFINTVHLQFTSMALLYLVHLSDVHCLLPSHRSSTASTCLEIKQDRWRWPHLNSYKLPQKSGSCPHQHNLLPRIKTLQQNNLKSIFTKLPILLLPRRHSSNLRIQNSKSWTDTLHIQVSHIFFPSTSSPRIHTPLLLTRTFLADKSKSTRKQSGSASGNRKGRERKKEELEEMQRRYQENNERIKQLEKTVDLLNSNLSKKSKKGSKSKNGKDKHPSSSGAGSSSRDGFYGDPF